ncbi:MULTISPECIES: hypothetical protein [unclassified Moorena]|uniref:hypothetical protein n=3 Tax=Moorena TaxID=1155738 RepID=UPI0013B5C15B|nr:MULTISPECIES: hypothetical protein [unclassified Moorena]NEP35644.1 hypothetical protein [Moorena sp. SIO3B2]NEQ09100.1 hypothetical protein [Moorena sp. SIO4E2]
MGRRIITTQFEAKSRAKIDGYFDRLIKYIPSEILGAWIAIKGVLTSANDVPINLIWVVFIFLVFVTPFWILKLTSESNKPPAVTQIVVSTGAFVVWVFALGEPFSSLGFYRPVYGSLLLILYNIIIPLFNPSELNS